MEESKVLNKGHDDIAEHRRAEVIKMDKNRKIGIDIIGYASWGTHFCQFYQTKEDLIDILVPYFKAGLENNEFCMWVTSKFLDVKEAEKALRDAIFDFDRYLKTNQIEIVPYAEWYLKGGTFNLQKVLNAWIDKLNQALAKGYDGMRVTGNTAWFEERSWRDFTDYEKEVNNAIGKYRMIAICTYPLNKCGASEIIDVVNNHQFVLLRREGKWESIESSQYKKAEEKIRNLARFPSENPYPVLRIAKDGTILYANAAAEVLLSEENYRVGQVLPERWRQLIYTVFTSGSVRQDIELEYKNRIFSWVMIPIANAGYVNIYGADITKRKKAEEEKEKLLYDIGKRVKELNCFYGFSKLVEKPGVSLEEIFKRITNLIPTNWQHPDITCTRIVFEDKEFKTDNFKTTKWKQWADIKIYGKKAGVVEVYYLEEKPESYEGPFLKEKRDLIEAIAERLGKIVERKKAEEEIKNYQKKIDAMIDSSSDLIFLKDRDFKYLIANKVHEKLFNIKIKDIIGKTDFDFMSKETAEGCRKSDEETLKSKSPIKKEEDVGGRIFEVVKQKVIDEKGNLLGIAAVIRDITEHRRSEEVLRMSEQKFRDLTETITDWIWEVDKDGVYTYASPKVKDVLGYEVSEVLGKTPFDLMPKEEAEKIGKFFKKKVIKKKSFYRLENINRHKNGHLVVLETSGIPILDEKGQLEGYRGIDRDITERKKAEELLQSSEKYFRSLIENALDIIGILNEDGTVRYVSPSIRRVLGYKPEKLIGKNIFKFIHLNDLPNVLNIFNDALQGSGIAQSVEVRVKHKDKTWRVLEAKGILHGEPPVNGLVLNARDITERKQAEEKIKQQRQKTEDLLAKLDAAYKRLKETQDELLKREKVATTGTLAAGVAHEIRNPLAIIGMTVQYLQSKLSEKDPKRELTEAIVKKVDRLDRVTRELSSYGRTMKLNIRKHNLARCLNLNLALIKPKCRVQGTKIKKKYSRLPLIEMDDEQMDKAFLNIMDNAIQVMSKGDVLTISTEFDEKVNTAVIKVQDTGPGIKKRHLSRIFDPFYTVKKKEGGTGLGLAITQSVILRHGGKIDVESKSSGKDRGTTFIIRLPLHPPPPRKSDERTREI